MASCWVQRGVVCPLSHGGPPLAPVLGLGLLQGRGWAGSQKEGSGRGRSRPPPGPTLQVGSWVAVTIGANLRSLS